MKIFFKLSTRYTQVVYYCLLAAIVAACSDDAKEIMVDSYLQPDVSTFSFDVDGTNTLTIHIESSADWAVEYKGDWLTELEATPTSLTIGATANDKPKVRTATITLKNKHGAESSVIVNQGFRLISSSAPYFFSVFNTELVISSSGEYAAYMSFEYDANGWPLWSPVITNMKTGEVTVGSARSNLQQEPIACCVTNEGSFIMQMPNSSSWNAKMKPIMLTVEGVEMAIDDGGYNNVAVQDISQDGKIMVGYVEGDDYLPCRWVDGRLELLSFPLEGLAGSTVYGALARSCSLDGTVIYGSEWNTELYSPMIWKNGNMSYIGADMVKVVNYIAYDVDASGGYTLENVSEFVYPTMSSKKQLSPNGRYVGSTYRGIYYMDESINVGYWTYYPGYFDLERNVYTVLENVPSGSGTTVSDDGLFFYRDGNYVGYVLDTTAEKVQTVNEWMLSKYSLVVPENSMILSLSADQKTICGYQVSYIAGNPFEMYWVSSAP